MDFFDRLEQALNILLGSDCHDQLAKARQNIEFLECENKRLRIANWALRSELDTCSEGGTYDYGGEDDT